MPNSKRRVGRSLRELFPARLIEPTAEALAHIGRNLRPEDVAELQAAIGDYDPNTILSDAVEMSTLAFVVGGADPIGVGGVVGDGLIWMVGTKEIEQRPRELIEFSRTAVARFKEAVPDAPFFYNHIDERNLVHIKYVKWLGAVFTGRSVTKHDPTVKFLEFKLYV